MKNIVLIGAANRGKSTLGALAAEKLGMRHLDVDQMVMEMAVESGDIRSIFRRFHEYQDQAVRTAMECKEPIILSTGAEILINPTALEALRTFGLVVHVKRPSSLSRENKSNLVIKRTVWKADGEEIDSIYDENMFMQDYEKDLHLYDEVADAILENIGTLEEGVEKLLALAESGSTA